MLKIWRTGFICHLPNEQCHLCQKVRVDFGKEEEEGNARFLSFHSCLVCAIYFLVFSYESNILRVKSEYILQVI